MELLKTFRAICADRAGGNPGLLPALAVAQAGPLLMAAATRGGEPGGIRVATLHPQAAGRVYAAYGGVYVSMALLWLWAVDSVRPSMTAISRVVKVFTSTSS